MKDTIHSNYMYSTSNGTRSFLERAVDKGVAPKHFIEIHDLYLTGLGMGTYLGDLDEETDNLVEEAVVKSIQSGAINVIDTAINYRRQLAEKSIGRGLQRLFNNGFERSEIFISTKNGYLTGDASKNMTGKEYVEKELIVPGIISQDDIVDGIHCMKPSFLEHQLEISLQNLQVDGIDLMYLHNVVQQQLKAVGEKEFLAKLRESFKFFETAREKGKIQFYGMATWDCFRVPENHPLHFNLEDAFKIAKDVGGENHGFKFIQLPLNMSQPEALTKKNQTINGSDVVLIEAANRLNIGVFTSVPLMQGEIINYDLPKLPNRTKAQTALEFIRSVPEIVAPLVGHKQQSHVEENIALSKESILSFDEYKEYFF